MSCGPRVVSRRDAHDDVGAHVQTEEAPVLRRLARPQKNNVC